MEESMLPESNSAPEIDMDGVPPTGSQRISDATDIWMK
jgi:hypothetical protein